MLAKILLAAVVLLLCAAAPAGADSYVVATYGTATTKCTFKVTLTRPLIVMWGSDDNWDFDGKTTCEVPVQQSGQAEAVGGDSWDYGTVGPLCSRFSTTCSSGGTANGDSFDRTVYRVRVTAPPGEAWLYSPYSSCAGTGTDNLSCTFTGTAIYRSITW